MYGEYWGVWECYGEVGMHPHMEYLSTRSLCSHCRSGLRGVGGSPSRGRGSEGEDGEGCVLLEL